VRGTRPADTPRTAPESHRIVLSREIPYGGTISPMAPDEKARREGTT